MTIYDNTLLEANDRLGGGASLNKNKQNKPFKRGLSFLKIFLVLNNNKETKSQKPEREFSGKA